MLIPVAVAASSSLLSFMTKRVLCLLPPGFEEIEAIAPVDLLCRAGAVVLLASLDHELVVKGRCGVTIHADVRLADVMDDDFDLLLIPGGPGVKAKRDDGRAACLARAYHDSGRPVAAICAAPTVLLDAGLLAGRRFTSHAGVRIELPATLCDTERVVEDGHLITSRGAATSVEFGLALLCICNQSGPRQRAA